MQLKRQHALPLALLVVVLGGCLAPVTTPNPGPATEDDAAGLSDTEAGTPPAPDGESATADRNGSATTGSEDGESAAQETDDIPGAPDPRSGPGTAEPISTTTTLNRSEITFYPENETIRYVAAYVHTNHEAVVNGTEPPEHEPLYEFSPVEEWLSIEAPHAGADAVREQIASQLDSNDSVSIWVSSPDNGTEIGVETSTVLSRDDEVLRTPNVSFERLQSVTPANVTVTIGIGDHSLTRTYPIVVQRTVLHYR